MADLELREIVFVRTGLGDGLSLDALLDHLGRDRLAWERADATFDERVLDAIDASDHRFLAEIDALADAARAAWSLRVRPIDDDLDAWLDLLAGLEQAEDPKRFLDDVGLSATRLAGVVRTWSAKMREDKELARRFEEGLVAPRGEPPKVTVDPPALDERRRSPRPPSSTDETIVPLGSATAVAATVPFDEEEGLAEPPPLLVPLPRVPNAKPPAIAFADRTQIARLGLEAATPLPFVEAVVAELPVESEATPKESLDETAPLPLRLDLSPELPFKASPGTKLALEIHAELTAQLALDPRRAAETLAQHRLTSAEKEREDAAWREHFEARPAERARWYALFVAASRRLGGRR